MAMSNRNNVLYDFGGFRLDPEERLLLCHGDGIPLTPRAFDTLLLLVENSGHVLRKEELIEKLWPESFVGENSLAQNISALRKALDEGNGQQYIETVPKLGYRFIAPVTKIESGTIQAPSALTSDLDPPATAGGTDLMTSRSTGGTDMTSPIAAEADLIASPTPDLVAVSGSVNGDVGPIPIVGYSNVRRRRVTIIALAAIMIVAAIVAYAVYSGKSRSTNSQSPIRLAVLPFRNLKQDANSDFLGFSLADAVITKLGYVNTLIVRPSAYVDKYRNQTIDPAQVANELKVDLLLTGSFIKEGDDLRIMTQLVDVRRNEIVWRDSMDLKYDKLVTVQDEVTAQVINGLQLQLSPAERENLSRDTPGNALAYEYFLHGVDSYSKNNFSVATAMLEKTVSLDPNYALAWAHLGRSYNAEAAFALEGHDAYEKAFAAYEKALTLNPQQVESRIFMANTYTDTGRVRQAIPLLKETIKAHPNLAEAHWELGYAYRFGGMLEESIRECERARQLDPKVKINNSAINSYLYSGEYAKFIQSLPSTQDVAYIIFYRGLGNYYMKNYQAASTDFDHAYELDPSLYSQVGKALSRGLAGQNNQGLALLVDLEQKIEEKNVRDAEGVYKVAQAYAVLGDKPAALRVLRRSIEGGFVCYPYFVSDPLLESLRREPEYKTLMDLAKQRHEDFKQQFAES